MWKKERWGGGGENERGGCGIYTCGQ
jgi:hypothetical protein